MPMQLEVTDHFLDASHHTKISAWFLLHFFYLFFYCCCLACYYHNQWAVSKYTVRVHVH